MAYCLLCRNVDVESELCSDCEQVTQKLSTAYAYYQEMSERNRQCCGGLSTEKDHFYFHGKYFDSKYPPDATESDCYVSVEYGVSFYKDYAVCYYLRDFDTYADSLEYGNSIPYTDPDFWDTLETEMEKAGEAAWNADLQSCRHCGYHMGDDHDCLESHEDEEDDDDMVAETQG